MKEKVLAILQSLKELSVFIGVVFVIMLVLTLLQMSQGKVEQAPDSFRIIVLSGIFYLFFLLRRYRRKNLSVLSVFEFKTMPLPSSLVLIGTGCVLNVWFYSLINTLRFYQPFDTFIVDALQETTAIFQNQPYLILIVIVGILMPLVEELLFRGSMQTALSKVFPIKTAIMIQAAVYSVIHVQPFQIIYTFFLGLLLGSIRVWSGSLLASVLMHSSFNLINLLLITYLNVDFVTSIVLFVVTTSILVWNIGHLRKEKSQ